MAAAVIADDQALRHYINRVEWRQESGIAATSVRLDFNLMLSPDLLVQQLRALSAELTKIANDAERLTDPAGQISLIQGRLTMERAKLKRRIR